MKRPSPDFEFKFDNPQEAIGAWMDAVRPTGRCERVALSKCQGRILAEAVNSDRPSPPCSVSAMDGYVLRAADLQAGRIDVVGEVAIGRKPPELPAGCALKIFTGAPVPRDGELIIKREDVEENDGYISVAADVSLRYAAGEHIRFVGENMPAGATVVSAGSLVDLPVLASLAAFGVPEPSVFQRLRVTVLITGDELRAPSDSAPEPWEIRNSNGPALEAWFHSVPWVHLLAVDHVVDDPSQMNRRIAGAIAESDAVVITGGVSMGDHDYVPNAVAAGGGEVIFHKLPVRPGKPILAAVGPEGQVVAGLPGNPVSVMVGLRRTVMPVLARRAGLREAARPQPTVSLTAPLDRPLPLWWYRPAQLIGHGRITLVPFRGSGDFAGIAGSDGFVEIPPNQTGIGPWPFWTWQVA